MDLVLAMDLKSGQVVHGMKGERQSYRPLDWGLSPTADPQGYIGSLKPRFLYVADLDRIAGTGDHTREILACASMVERCYVDRGARSPDDFLQATHLANVVGTETAGDDLSGYPSGYLSIDIRDGKVVPGGEDPASILHKAGKWSFEGCILLHISAVGTGTGVPVRNLEEMRSAYEKTLIYGGGIAGPDDLALLQNAGFDGAIVATAVHRGHIALESIRRGEWH